MLYNKNIILNILNNIFFDEIKTYVQKCMLEMDIDVLEKYFGQEVDYAILGMINQMAINDYEIENESESQIIISGTMEISTNVDGYVHWDGEEIYVDSAPITIELLYEFHVENEEYTDLYLEYL